MENDALMMLVSTYIAPSAIEGVGVFAAEPIAAGQLIWRLDPTFDRLLPKSAVETYPPHFREFIERYTYPLLDDPETLVLEVDNGRFMNHDTRSPNTRFNELTTGYALKDIAVGEELTCDYGEFDPEFEIIPGRLFVAADAKPNGELRV